MMKTVDLKRALPEMPESFERRMRFEIERMDEDMRPKMKMSLALLVAIIMVILMAGAAVAANTGLLGKLFPNGAPEAAQALLTVDNLVDEDNGIKLTVKEHLYDGRSFHIVWDVESMRDEGVFLRSYGDRFDNKGDPIVIDSWSNVASSLDLDRDGFKAVGVEIEGEKTAASYEGRVSCSFHLADAPAGDWTYVLNIEVYKTDLKPVPLKLSKEEMTDAQREYDLMLDGLCFYGMLTDEQIWARDDAGEIMVDSEGMAEFTRSRDYDAKGDLTQMQKVAQVRIEIPMRAIDVERKQMASPMSHAFADVKLSMSEMGFDLTGAWANYELTPVGDVSIDDMISIDSICLMLDQDGAPINEVFQFASWNRMPLDDGRGASIQQGGAVPASIPTQVRLLRADADTMAPLIHGDYETVFAAWQANPEAFDEMIVELE